MDEEHKFAELLPGTTESTWFDDGEFLATRPDLLRTLDASYGDGYTYKYSTVIVNEEDTGEAAAFESMRQQLLDAQRDLQQLKDQHINMLGTVDSRARAAAVQLIKDSNARMSDVAVVASTATARERHRATAYELHDNFFVNAWNRDADSDDDEIMSSPPEGGDFEGLFFACKMVPDDFKRHQKANAQPQQWRNAPKLTALDQSILGTGGVSTDTGLRDKQVALLKPVKPVIAALDFIARALHCVPDVGALGDGFEAGAISANDAAELVQQLHIARAHLSDSVHTVAYGVIGHQKSRDRLLQRAAAGGELALQEELDGAD